MSSEKFHIISQEGPENVTPSERFKIKPKKEFQMLAEKNTESPGVNPTYLEDAGYLWFKQENSNDCGPAMLLNMLGEFGITTAHSIAEVRAQVNELRSRSGRMLLGENAWLNTEDVGRYLSDIAGLNVEEYTCSNDNQDEIFRAIQDNLDQGFDAMYTTSGRHFRAIINGGEDGEFLLDSFTDGPQQIDISRREDQVRQNVFSNRTDTIDRVGIVRSGREPGYRMHHL